MNSLALCLTICLTAASTAQSLDNTFDVALGTAGLNTGTARFDPQIVSFFQDKSHAGTFYQSAYANPWRLPFLMSVQRDLIASASDRPADSLAAGARMVGPGVRRTILGNPIQAAEQFASRPGSLAGVLERMRRSNLISGNVPVLTSIPEPARQAAALILTVLMDVAPMRRAAFSNVENVESLFVRARTPEPAGYDADRTSRMLKDIERVDMPYLFGASQDIAMACTIARNKLLGIDTSEKFNFKIASSWGEIIISGGGDNKYEGGPTLLILDSGGSDTYVGYPSNRTASNWASLVVDSRGNDKYVSHERLVGLPIRQDAGRKSANDWGPGGATMGVSMIFDMQGDDLYRSETPGLASGTFGVGFLSDTAGNDIYDAYVNSQGYGYFGLGIIEDMAGDDKYAGFSAVQGYGGPGGFGAIIDRQGNDSYVANNVDLDFPSPQTAQANVSMAQGAGVGRRADYLDGHSLSGGVGVMYDLDGNDSYSCGVFGQGVGYWDGVGALWDRGGNDLYSGVWYVQGAAAHFGIGYLEDEGGADEYVATQNMALGAGHDFSVGMIMDRFGADTYKAPNLSLGASSANGWGVFLDFDGNDQYNASNITLGRSADVPKNSLRERGLGIGLFYDGGGTDTYPAATNWAINATRIVNWTDRNDRATESQFGIFWDR
ncbi:MAG: hypothetical protein IT206_05145 [Fimbriimonadaceae bacterium]|nr:hypothetical protein [Fimbriimonadaceae bacterium]